MPLSVPFGLNNATDYLIFSLSKFIPQARLYPLAGLFWLTGHMFVTCAPEYATHLGPKVITFMNESTNHNTGKQLKSITCWPASMTPFFIHSFNLELK